MMNKSAFIFVLFCVFPVFAGEMHLEKITKAVREDYLAKAQVWRPVEIEKVDISAGPRSDISVPPGAEFECQYQEPKGVLPGIVAKFLCKTQSGTTVRVKFGEENPEIYSEVAGTRLFWALGFYADEVYPVILKCHGCPEKNFAQPDPNEKRITGLIRNVIVERNFPGVVIEEYEDQGWKWSDSEKVSEKKGGAPRIHIDALRLLAVFVQHADSKPDNQRLACFSEDIEDSDGDGQGHCKKPVLMVQDLGAVFGSGTDIATVSKMSFSDWKEQEIWNGQKEADYHKKYGKPACFGNITASRLGGEEGLNDPAISEEGRKFLADLLNRLSEKQITDIFRVAGVEKMGDVIDEDGVKRPVTAEDWTRLFIKKRKEITDRRCP